jgi:hypothetical protein
MQSSDRRYLIASLLLHLALFLVLFAGSFFSRKIVMPPVIERARAAGRHCCAGQETRGAEAATATEAARRSAACAPS